MGVGKGGARDGAEKLGTKGMDGMDGWMWKWTHEIRRVGLLLMMGLVSCGCGRLGVMRAALSRDHVGLMMMMMMGAAWRDRGWRF